jgi:glucoamylase
MDRFRRAAAGIAAAIERHLWSDDHGRYLRSRLLGRADGGGLPLPRQFERQLRYPNRIVRSADPVDARLDAALLGLAWPFAAVDPGSPRMRATADTVEHVLTAPCGGLHRFEGDTYAGGNPWPLCTLWLGLHRRQARDEAGFRRALDYVVSRATPLGLLPEQVHPDGSPAWVVPLAWSHALLVLAARPELALG